MAAKQAEFDNGIKVDGTANINGDMAVSGNLNVSGSLTYAGTATSDIIPASNNAYHLGSATNVWVGAYLSNFVANSTVSLFRNVAVTLPAATTSIPSLNMPHGVAPTSPVNGDIWTTTTGTFIRINNATKNVAFIDSTVNAASQLETGRYVKLTGDATGTSEIFNGTGNVNIAVTLTNSYYTQAQSDSRYANTSDPVFTGTITPSANGGGAGNTTKRWAIWATTANLSANLTVSGNASFGANVAITGNLTVQGSPIDVTAGHITTTANGITFTGGGTTNSQIIITRAAEANAVIRWNESANVWMFSNGDGTFLNNVLEQNTVAYAISISGLAANATHATTAANAVQLNGQAASYYTDIVSRLGYTPVNKAGDTGLGSLTPAANTTQFGNTTQRWVITANTLDLSSTLGVSGLTTLATVNVTSTAELRGVTTLHNNIVPVSNAAAIQVGTSAARPLIFANTINASGTITGTLDGTANNASYFNGQLASYYTNADNLASGTVPEARLNQANATTNGIMRVLDSVVNTSITIAAAANSVKQAYDAAVSLSSAAYSNAVTYATNATNLGNGTVAIARLPTMTSGDFRANTLSKILTTDGVWADANIVALSDGANIAVNMNNGFNFTVTLAGNRHLDNPTNAKAGQSGVIFVKQDATGSRTLAYGSNWKWAGGLDPTLTTTASATDMISYFCQNSTFIAASIAKAFS